MAAPYDQALVRREGFGWKRIGGQTLCEVCGAQHRCDLTRALTTLAQHKGATAGISQCDAYLPVISFQDCAGIEGSFNTFRRGKGWANRVAPGQRVALFDLAGKALLGTAMVDVVDSGPLGEMLDIHAPMNHLMKVRQPHEAPLLLLRVLRRLYGNTYAAASAPFSVIGLRMEE